MSDVPPPPPGSQQPTGGTPPPPPPPSGAAPPPGYVPYTPVPPTGLPPGVTATSPWARLGAYFLEILLVLVTLFIGWLIWAAILAGNGQTPAKNLLKQRVIRLDNGRPAGFALMLFMRGIVAGFIMQFAIIFTLGIILFMPFWDKKNQNLWDKISSTRVVNDPYDAWNTKGP